MAFAQPSRRQFIAAGTALALLPAFPARAQVTAFMQEVAARAASDEALAAFYRANGYQPIWTGETARDAARRRALLSALDRAGDHALPAARYARAVEEARLGEIRSERDLGRAEVALSALFLAYARDVQTGVIEPRSADAGLVREVPLRDGTETLTAFARAEPVGYMRSLPPQSPEYAMLMKGRLALQEVIHRGGWGPTVNANALEPGDSGRAVVALRDRLIAMGYLRRSASASYDAAMMQAVQRFQLDHGLAADGVAGGTTMAEINVSPEARLRSVVVALERERWINMPGGLGARHVKVNLTDFSARIVDNDKVTFQTRAVIGADTSDRRSPEFSDEMEHMVVNPTWNVPRSIATKEYLPMMQRNPNAAGHLRLIDSRGRVVPRGAVNFSAYNARNFPFAMKQPPSRNNALGLVKFMFPNRYNIYLHDTPAKSLFERETRAFSHGCIRLNDPFEFAYTLLARQTDDPEGLFHRHLRTGNETVLKLDQHVPVHLDYRTAIGLPRGGLEYRRDVYGRDGRIAAALDAAGVAFTTADS